MAFQNGCLKVCWDLFEFETKEMCTSRSISNNWKIEKTISRKVERNMYTVNVFARIHFEFRLNLKRKTALILDATVVMWIQLELKKECFIRFEIVWCYDLVILKIILVSLRCFGVEPPPFKRILRWIITVQYRIISIDSNKTLLFCIQIVVFFGTVWKVSLKVCCITSTTCFLLSLLYNNSRARWHERQYNQMHVSIWFESCCTTCTSSSGSN